MTWEYRILECDANSDALAAELVPQGKQGFELVSALPFDTQWSKTTAPFQRYRLIFKREYLEDKTPSTSFLFGTHLAANDFVSRLRGRGIVVKPIASSDLSAQAAADLGTTEVFQVALSEPTGYQIELANRTYQNVKQGFKHR